MRQDVPWIAIPRIEVRWTLKGGIDSSGGGGNKRVPHGVCLSGATYIISLMCERSLTKWRSEKAFRPFVFLRWFGNSAYSPGGTCDTVGSTRGANELAGLEYSGVEIHSLWSVSSLPPPPPSSPSPPLLCEYAKLIRARTRE